MSRATGITRVALGALLSAAAVVGVVAADAVPWPSVGGTAPSVDVTPAAAETLLACDGPLLALGRTAEDASGLSVAADMQLFSGNELGETPEQTELAISDVEDATAPLVRQLPDGRQPVSAAAATSTTVDATDLGGFAASECRTARMESWIVGGDASTGSTGILLIANPTDVNAVVSIDVYGVDGVTTPAGADAIAIPAGTQVPIPLAGLVGSESAPAVKVTASGAPVRVTLQSSLVRTLDPGGVDLQAPVTPDDVQVIPGVGVTEEASSSDNSASILRLLSTSDTTATVSVIAEGGSERAREPEQVTLTADQPLSLDLGSLPEGRYSVVVEAIEPVVAAVWQATGFGSGSDYAWYPSAPALDEQTVFAVPNGPGGEVGLVNDSDEDATVVLARDGEEQSVVVPANGFVSVGLDGTGVYTLDPGGSAVHASVGYLSETAIAAIPVDQDASAPQAITVYP